MNTLKLFINNFENNNIPIEIQNFIKLYLEINKCGIIIQNIIIVKFPHGMCEFDNLFNKFRERFKLFVRFVIDGNIYYIIEDSYTNFQNGNEYINYLNFQYDFDNNHDIVVYIERKFIESVNSEFFIQLQWIFQDCERSYINRYNKYNDWDTIQYIVK